MKMSKILLINGSPNEHGCTFTALSEIADTLSKNGVESELLYLGKKPMAGCIDCGKCFQTGRCVFGDQVNEVLEKPARPKSWTNTTASLWDPPSTTRDPPGSSALFWTGCSIVVKAGWLVSWGRLWSPAGGAGPARPSTV